MDKDVLLLLQGHAAKRKLAQSFQVEGTGQANHPSSAILTGTQFLQFEQASKQNNKPFRETFREYERVRRRTATAIRPPQPHQMKRDLTVSGFVFTLVSVGAIVAAYTDQPIFWFLVGPAPVAVLETVRTFLRHRLRRHEGLLEFYEPDR
jgi:hypothetical protein